MWSFLHTFFKRSTPFHLDVKYLSSPSNFGQTTTIINVYIVVYPFTDMILYDTYLDKFKRRYEDEGKQ